MGGTGVAALRRIDSGIAGGAMVGTVAAAAERKTCIFVGLEKSRAGSKAKSQGEEDGERAPHLSI
jgi:hypothetical protein